MDFNSQIASLERDLHVLRIEFDRFMAGAIRVPPEELRFQIGKRLRSIRTSRRRSSVERFRLNTFEASFNTLSDLHARRLREIESGKKVRGKPLAKETKPDPEQGFQVGERPERRAVTALYDKLYGSKGRSQKADFDSFNRHVAEQVARLREKTGCEKVHLRVTGEGDSLKLKAKPVRQKKETPA